MEQWKEWYGEAKGEKLDEVFEFLEPYMMEAGVTLEESTQIKISVEELLVNVASYAYEDNWTSDEKHLGKVIVKCGFSEKDNLFYVALEDWGKPYNPLEQDEPDITLSAEERRIGGLGILMVKTMMDQVQYEYKEGKNCILIAKNI